MANALLSNLIALVGPAVETARMVPIQTLGAPLWDLTGSVPSLDQNFAETLALNESVTGQNLITFTRASTGTYIGSDRLMRTAAINEARFTHDPVSGEPLGLLVEERRTNLLLRSEEFDNAYWVKGGLSVTANQDVAPDGTQTADRITISASGHSVYAFVTVTASTTYTLSFYAKRGTATAATYSVINDSAGGANIIAPTSYYSQLSATRWTRVSVTFTTPAGCTSIGVYPLRDSGVSSGTMFLWGAMLEAGSGATSYIKNVDTAAGVTRSADLASLEPAAFGSFYRQDEGTLFADVPIRFAANDGQVAEGADSSSFKGISLEVSTSGTRINLINRTITNAAGIAYITGMSHSGPGKIAAAYSPQGADIALNGGGTVVKASSTQAMTPDRLWIGSRTGSSGFLNGTIRRLVYWPRRLSNPTLQAITL